MTKDEEMSKLRKALMLAKEMIICNGLDLPKTMEVVDEALVCNCYPEHCTHSPECWCDPEIQYTDGDRVIIHRRPN